MSALAEIRRRFKKTKKGLLVFDIAKTEVAISPRKAFFSEKHPMLLAESLNQIAGEMVMCYPPGIPIVAPGELITQEIIDHIEYARAKGCFLMGTEDPTLQNIQVVKYMLKQK